MKATEDSYRLYSCVRCGCQVCVCRACDRGNQYCASSCARVRRRESLRRAGQRYQRTRRGAHRHAVRQRRWRERQGQIVTHQGSAAEPAQGTIADIATVQGPPAPHAPIPIVVPATPLASRVESARCSFCHGPLPRLARLGRLRAGP